MPHIPQQLDVSQSFCVMLHDVAPIYAEHVATFTKSLAPMVGNAMSAAVVPCWAGVPFCEKSLNTIYTGWYFTSKIHSHIFGRELI